MPVTRYFLWVGGVLLVLLFIADACLPGLPARKAADASRPVIRIYSEPKWPERIVFDTSVATPRVASAASPVQESAPVPPDRTREAMAQLQTADGARVQAEKPKKPEAQRRQKIARRHIERPPFWGAARPPFRITRQSQYAWFGGGVWW
jgi:hypothetical protein